MLVPISNDTPSPSPSNRPVVDILILGAGWTSTFLLPLLHREHISHAATTRDGRQDTIRFTFDPTSDDPAPFRALPHARTVLITFPLQGRGPASKLVSLYERTHHHHPAPRSSSSETHQQQGEEEGQPKPHHHHFILFGATSIWNAPTWQDETSPYDTSNPRAIAEDELLSLASSFSSSSSSSTTSASASVLSLAGLYGGARQPRDWVDRVIRGKEDLRAKGALHVIHGEDVARAVVALHRQRWRRSESESESAAAGKRWLLCDLHVYDWWDLVEDWATAGLRLELEEEEEDRKGAGGGGEGGEEKGKGNEGEREKRIERHRELLGWVGELMVEEGVKALPRDTERLGRRLDGRAFWKAMGIWPVRGRIR
ncbi:hypothetical protein F4778DRAFT_782965 [Xylariomycetidae sp. FL2044]|nr:hypothetical protein F4778DRAFT_782965 [Xylariomycetidae sp. FL2044]